MKAVLTSTLLAAALGSLATSTAAAQNTFQQQVQRYMANAASRIRELGYNPDREMITGSLNDDASETMRINLQGGGRYAIVGVCDNDCSDFDLRIWGPDGTKLDEDIETDDTPVLEFVAPVTGQYRLSVEMPSCRQNPCYWGVQVYAR
jgi:type II secretory pathway pseudopilin PulG